MFAITAQWVMTIFLLIQTGDSLQNVNKKECPKQEPDLAEKCSGNITCTYDEECCCGKCHPSKKVMCKQGSWISKHTDACLGAGMFGCENCRGNQDCTSKQKCVDSKCVSNRTLSFTIPKCPKCCAHGCKKKYCGNSDICPQ